MTVMIDMPAEFGRLAELAASATDADDIAIVEGRLAAALAAVPDPLPAAVASLIGTARDATRSLPRRAAALAELHRAFARRPGPPEERP